MPIPGSIPPAKFGSGPAEAENPDHTGLGHDDPGVVPQRDSGCDSPEQLAYAALAWGGRSAGLDTDSDCELWMTGDNPARRAAVPALEDGQLGSIVNRFAIFSLYCVTPWETSEAHADRAAIITERPHKW